MTRASIIDFSNRHTDSKSMDDQPISRGKSDTYVRLDDQLCEGATHHFTDASAGEPWLSAEMVPDNVVPCGSEAFQIIDLGRSACSSTWLERRQKRQQLPQRKR